MSVRGRRGGGGIDGVMSHPPCLSHAVRQGSRSQCQAYCIRIALWLCVTSSLGRLGVVWGVVRESFGSRLGVVWGFDWESSGSRLGDVWESSEGRSGSHCLSVLGTL